ncbi:lipase family protein [[Clostridium] polysaccharolyticum]|uniref:Lipase (Class 3) n=1 Tax=[Clostridium] polysaccharolyticum TaxID=29364 RepID=A0A1I0EJS3_9FIRM|nr:hypothetical protein [[Clostridium] polysaccharolyticum]SET45417.1 Lipase (class 3) [[Clostridium] polysaccharolyticum]
MRKRFLRNTAILMALVLGVNSITPVSLKAEAASKLTEEQEAEKDTDKDGLQDYLEEFFGTDKALADTDGDGLSDLVEITKIKTDPLKEDSNSSGKSDGSEDADKDGLSNLLEIQMGTDPVKSDTDEDGLKDGLEVNVYLTSPKIEDSDGDGLLDGEEVELKLSPMKKYTRSLEKDSKRRFSQILQSENIEECLVSKENLAIPSLLGNLPGLIAKRVRIESATAVLDGLEDKVIGKPVEVVEDYDQPVDMKLSFYCPKSTRKQVKNYKIARFNDGVITYLDTTVSLKKVTAKITEGGTYFVVSAKDSTSKEVSLLSTKMAVKSAKKVQLLALSYDGSDSDYDGIADYADPKPNDNGFAGTVKNGGFDINSHVDYAMDYRAFFGAPSAFNSQLCKISSIYANMAYGFEYADETSNRTYDFTSLMNYQGLSDVRKVDLRSIYSDYDVSTFYIGHRTVTYQGITKDIISVSVKGTGSTIDEWTSNFDVGNTAQFSKYADWTDSTNHKGFDVVAVRIQRYIKDYVSNYCSSSNTKAYWVVGHSRGAAVANILGAKLTDAGSTVYTYTFATPNTTTKSAATTSRYTNIFNVVNKDDFVPYLPCTAWGFRRYGRTSIESIASKYEKEWEDLTDIFDYNPDTYGLEDTIDELASVTPNRNRAYAFTCKCHGDGSSNDITIKNRGMSEKSREGAIAKIPNNALPYCRITRYKGKAFWGWDFDNCQSPCYFMQLIAAMLSNEISIYRFVVELNIADHYEDAKTALISSGIGGLEHPHYTEGYYILAKHAAASNFS